jgi:hypothetical protein
MSTIERAEVLITSPGRNFTTLKITTSDGVTGLGDATLNGRELSVVALLRAKRFSCSLESSPECPINGGLAGQPSPWQPLSALQPLGRTPCGQRLS